MNYLLQDALKVRTGTEPVTTFYLSRDDKSVWQAYGKEFNTSDLIPKSFSIYSDAVYSLIEQTSEVVPCNRHWRFAFTGAFGVGLLADFVEDHLMDRAENWLLTHIGGLAKAVTPHQLLEALRSKYAELSGQSAR